MPAKRKWTEEQLHQIREMFHSSMTNREVGAVMGCDYNRSIKSIWVSVYGKKAVHDRFRESCRRSKMGDLNPMKNIDPTKHPNYVKESISTQGYRMVDYPEWWAGARKGAKYLEHVIVACQKYGITELPKGYVVHHIDEDKLNNDPGNLQIMTRRDHMRHHSTERKAQRLSRKGVGVSDSEKHST